MFKFVEAEKKITSLDIRFANVATIYHDPDSWPKAGGLLLNGLVYKNVGIAGGLSLDGLVYNNVLSVPHFMETGENFWNGCAFNRQNPGLYNHTNSWPM